jgi:hypothetical protein
LFRNTANRNGNIGFDVIDGSGTNVFLQNTGCINNMFDAFSDGTGTGNVWTANSFCTSSGIQWFRGKRPTLRGVLLRSSQGALPRRMRSMLRGSRHGPSLFHQKATDD